MHDSYTPIGGLIPMWLIQLGEVIFGGVGSGLYGMLVFAIIAVFIAGLMVGRTPEYLGKKLEAFEMKMASLVILIPPFFVAGGHRDRGVGWPPAAPAPPIPARTASREILYAFSSAANNNGSAFAGLSANTPFYNTLLGIVMWISRYWLIVPVLAIAGSLAAKKHVPAGAGTLPTHTPLFVVLLAVDGGDRRRAGVLSGAGARADRGRTAVHGALIAHRRTTCTHRITDRSRTVHDYRRARTSAVRSAAGKRGDQGLVHQARALGAVAQSGHVRGAGRQRADHRAVARAARRRPDARKAAPGFVLAIALWLWATLLFANFAESLAEGRGKAQAAALRSSKRDVIARRFPNGRTDAAL